MAEPAVPVNARFGDKRPMWRSGEKPGETDMKNIHVVPKGNDWGVQRAGCERASFIMPTQSQAIDKARDMGRREGAEVRIHRPNGQIRDSISYGNDPCPPRDKR
jgi:hypothetical protein